MVSPFVFLYRPRHPRHPCQPSYHCRPFLSFLSSLVFLIVTTTFLQIELIFGCYCSAYGFSLELPEPTLDHLRGQLIFPFYWFPNLSNLSGPIFSRYFQYFSHWILDSIILWSHPSPPLSNQSWHYFTLI